MQLQYVPARIPWGSSLRFYDTALKRLWTVTPNLRKRAARRHLDTSCSLFLPLTKQLTKTEYCEGKHPFLWFNTKREILVKFSFYTKWTPSPKFWTLGIKFNTVISWHIYKTQTFPEQLNGQICQSTQARGGEANQSSSKLRGKLKQRALVGHWGSRWGQLCWTDWRKSCFKPQRTSTSVLPSIHPAAIRWSPR